MNDRNAAADSGAEILAGRKHSTSLIGVTDRLSGAPKRHAAAESVAEFAVVAVIGRRGLGMPIRRRPAGPRTQPRMSAGTPPARPDQSPSLTRQCESSGSPPRPQRRRRMPVHRRTPTASSQHRSGCTGLSPASLTRNGWTLLAWVLPEPWRAEALVLLVVSAYVRGDREIDDAYWAVRDAGAEARLLCATARTQGDAIAPLANKDPVAARHLLIEPMIQRLVDLQHLLASTTDRCRSSALGCSSLQEGTPRSRVIRRHWREQIGCVVTDYRVGIQHPMGPAALAEVRLAAVVVRQCRLSRPGGPGATVGHRAAGKQGNAV
jgi:hypothetical protein